jgi:hypothetical protein
MNTLKDLKEKVIFMENKKIIAIAIVLFMMVIPASLMFMPTGIADVESANINPIRGFELSVAPDMGSVAVALAETNDKLCGGALREYTMVVHLDVTNGTDCINATMTFGSLFEVYWNNTLALPEESSSATGVTLGTLANTTWSGDPTTLNFTIPVTFAWTVTDADNIGLVWEMYDLLAGKGSGTEATTYDVVSTLTIATADFISLSDYGTGKMIVVSNIVFSYTGTDGNAHPLDAQTDFYITRSPSSGVTDSWNPSSYVDGTGVSVWADIIAGSVSLVETFTVAAYTQGGTTTDLMSTTYSDTVTLTHDGGGEDPPVFTGLSSNTMVLLAIVGIIAILCWKSGKTDAVVAKRKPTKRKRKR